MIDSVRFLNGSIVDVQSLVSGFLCVLLLLRLLRLRLLLRRRLLLRLLLLLRRRLLLLRLLLLLLLRLLLLLLLLIIIIIIVYIRCLLALFCSRSSVLHCFLQCKWENVGSSSVVHV